MSDRRKEAEEKMAKAIFISADCWLCVFDLLPASQLGFGIAMISHRFDFYVGEHFKTRKWTLKPIQIERKIGENVTKEMEIVNSHGKPMPIPQIQMPRKVSGFERIIIYFIDRNAIAFLHRFRPFFATFPINLSIDTNSERIFQFICTTFGQCSEITFVPCNCIFPPFAQIRPVNSQRFSIASCCPFHF
ncbi:hypothetical protein niasHT_018382 [Heterodera trifolii]|uniref:Uncharacterized protein n=1 Tax=Heterodera trifolii TaxID=157864 RepID=A0ABD2LDB9_9BILA